MIGTLKICDSFYWFVYSDKGQLKSIIMSPGDMCDVSIGGVWIRVRIEADAHGLYLTTDEESFRPFEGMKVRIK